MTFAWILTQLNEWIHIVDNPINIPKSGGCWSVKGGHLEASFPNG